MFKYYNITTNMLAHTMFIYLQNYVSVNKCVNDTHKSGYSLNI